MKSWLKGGLTASGIFLLLSVLSIFPGYLSLPKGVFFFLLLSSLISSIVIGFPLGVIIVWIYGKIITKKQANPNISNI